MPDSIAGLLNELQRLSEYAGPWRLLRDEAGVLRERVHELRERQARLDDLLIVALVGGSGVGKSTLLNALAGDALAPTSEFRPCTSSPTVYHPPNASITFPGWNAVSGSALEHLVLVDTPDSDTIMREHRQSVIGVLAKCDLILLCGSPDKYLDEATWSLLRPLQGERAIACIETKAEPQTEAIREHWQARLREQGFDVGAYFRVNALRAFERKVAGTAPRTEEGDFAHLEQFLREELDAERVMRIKRANANGLLTKAISRLRDHVGSARAGLDDLEQRLARADHEIAVECLAAVERRLFQESHLWNFALGREIGLRAKGLVGTLYRLLEAARTLPARLAGWIPGTGAGLARQAASLLSTRETFEDELRVATQEIVEAYRRIQSEAALAFVRAGFDAPAPDAGLEAFQAEISERVTAVLRGPARDGVVRRARMLTGWPVSVLADLPPVLLILYSGYHIVVTFFGAGPIAPGYVSHALTILAILLGLELFFFSSIARGLAWSARRHAAHALRAALYLPRLALSSERAALQAARDHLGAIEHLKNTIPS